MDTRTARIARVYLPNMNPDEEQDELYQPMGNLMDFIGQRADKVVIKDILDGDDPREEDSAVIVKGGVQREVISYTMTCPECAGVGYYDDIGQVICEDCGVVISGEEQATLAVEYNADADDSMGSSRGLEKMPGTRNSRGTHEPSI